MMSTRLFGAFIFLFLIILVDIILASVYTTNSWYYAPNPTQLDDVSTMHVFDHASLFPYNGNWTSSTTTNATEATCALTCLNDSTCKAFFMHTDSTTAANNACYFYTQPQTQAMLGANVNVSNYFATTNTFIVGRNTPSVAAKTYIKPATPYKSMPSVYQFPWIVSTT